MERLLALALSIVFTSGHVLPNLDEASQRLIISENNTPADVKKIPGPGINLFIPAQTVQVEDSIPAVYSAPLVQNIPITIAEPVHIIQEVAILVTADDNLPVLHACSLEDGIVKNVQSAPEVIVEQTVPVEVESAPVIQDAPVAPLVQSAPVEDSVEESSVTIESLPVVQAAPVEDSVEESSVTIESLPVVQAAPVIQAASAAPVVQSVPVEDSVEESSVTIESLPVVQAAPVIKDALVRHFVQSVPVEDIVKESLVTKESLPVVQSAPVIQAAPEAPLVQSAPVEDSVEESSVTIESIPVVQSSPIIPPMVTMVQDTEMVAPDTIVIKAPEPLEAPNPPMPSVSIPYVGGQFHAQDELGQYTFGHHGGPSTRIESKDYFGRLRGSFAYINSEGEIHVRKYAAAPGMGFKVEGSDIPIDESEPTKETDEVVKARAAHMKLLKESKKIVTEESDVSKVEPKAVDITLKENQSP